MNEFIRFRTDGCQGLCYVLHRMYALKMANIRWIEVGR